MNILIQFSQRKVRGRFLKQKFGSRNTNTNRTIARLASSTHPAVSRAIVLPLPRISHGTARPDCCCVFAAPHLHCVSWPHPNTGRSPVRPIAVVVYLIRPNRGLTAVLLGKSTTTTKAGPGAEFQKEFKKFTKFKLN